MNGALKTSLKYRNRSYIKKQKRSLFTIDFKLYFVIFFFIEQEEKEKAEKEKKEKEKIEREALKKAMKNERKQLRTLCKDNEYFTEDADEKVQNLTDLDRCELCYVFFFFF